jgi:hypothetical protein
VTYSSYCSSIQLKLLPTVWNYIEKNYNNCDSEHEHFPHSISQTVLTLILDMMMMMNPLCKLAFSCYIMIPVNLWRTCISHYKWKNNVTITISGLYKTFSRPLQHAWQCMKYTSHSCCCFRTTGLHVSNFCL